MKSNFTKEDFYKLLKPNGDCLEWTGATHRQGYGFTRLNDKMVTTHRLAYKLEHGHIPEDKIVCHTCDNPVCCKPEHLFVGTQQDNMNDKTVKGRGNQPKGDAHGGHKLTEEQVLEIRELVKTSMIQKDIADMYGIGRSNVSAIKLRKKWKHI